MALIKSNKPFSLIWEKPTKPIRINRLPRTFEISPNRPYPQASTAFIGNLFGLPPPAAECKTLRSQRFMRAVTKWGVLCPLAIAKPFLFGFGHREFEGVQTLSPCANHHKTAAFLIDRRNTTSNRRGRVQVHRAPSVGMRDQPWRCSEITIRFSFRITAGGVKRTV